MNLSSERKKAAIADWKRRKSSTGLFAVRCLATSGVWVGKSPNLDNAQNGLWFALRMGRYPNRELQAAWQEHGIANFAFEILERLDDEEDSWVVEALLKERMVHWQQKLEAGAV